MMNKPKPDNLPPPPVLQQIEQRERWVTWWSATDGRHTKTFGYADEVTPKQAQRIYQTWLDLEFKRKAHVRAPRGEEAQFKITRLAAMYLRHARRTYVKDGKPTTHVGNVLLTMRALRDACGNKPAAAFEAPDLAALRDGDLIWWRKPIRVRGADGTVTMRHEVVARSIKTVNTRLKIIVQAFALAREKGLIPRETLLDLMTVARLRRGRTAARSPVKVSAVDDERVAATLKHLPAVVADMVRILAITGFRPQEICSMRGCDLDRSAPIWLYRPRHKLEHLEDQLETIRCIGPKAQAILKRYLAPAPYKIGLADRAYLFSPAEAQAQRWAMKLAARKTKMFPSHAAKRSPDPARKIGRRYTTQSLRKAIHHACRKGGIPQWNPNQLRHAVGTRLRKKYGIEDASVQLGHKYLNTTEIYADKDLARAMQIALEVG